VVLLGATSQIGVFLIPRLLDAGISVTAVSRDERLWSMPRREDLQWISPRELTAVAEGGGLSNERRGALISCGPIDQAALLLHSETAVDALGRAIVFSTSSVHTKMDSPDPIERLQMEQIRHQEAMLRVACERAGIPLYVLRPTLIYGCGMDQNLSRLFRWIRRYRFMPVAGKASGLRQPVHADDLAAVACALAQLPGGQDLDGMVCGGSRITYRHMVERLFTALGRKPRILSLPPDLLAAAGGLVGRFSGASRLSGQMILRQNRDLDFDDTQVRELTAIEPRPFRPTPCDFSLPPHPSTFGLPVGE
jgi:nucleoside-diphosphate-sugar epimerase